MLDRDTRAAILRLREQGHALRKIAQDLGVSRNTIRDVIKDGTSEGSSRDRPRDLTAFLDHIRALYAKCEGNIVRVQEDLQKQHGVAASYSTLTRFCRREFISRSLPVPAAHIVTDPGEEMQHDTSLYTLLLGGRKVKRHCASLVLGYSRRLFIRFYPKFDRFACKLFLTAAFKFMGGACRRCVIDNSSVVLACGAGSTAQVAPELEAFEKRFGFRFLAHELGHADRKGKCERCFSYVEGNFLAGRSFKNDDDLNRQALQWLDERANVRRIRDLGSSPQELFAAEQPHLVPLPLYIPEPYKLFHRDVDAYGYIHVDTRRYSAPPGFIGKELEIRETENEVLLFDGSKELARHTKLTDPAGPFKATLPDHVAPRRRESARLPPLEEAALRALGGAIPDYLDGLKKARPGRPWRWSLKILHRLLAHYPSDALAQALAKALEHRLWDVRRIEGVLLQILAKDQFQLPLFAEDYESNPEFDKGAVTPPPDLDAFNDPPAEDTHSHPTEDPPPC
jgi:transposase